MQWGRVGLVLVWVTGCGANTRPVRAPARETVAVLAQTLPESDPAPVYRMVAAGLKERLSWSAFMTAWNGSTSERERRAQEMAAGDASVRESAYVRLASERAFRLDWTGERWAVVDPLPRDPRFDAPAAAARAFAASVRTRDLDHILALLSSGRRQEIEANLGAVDQGLGELPQELAEKLSLLSPDRAQIQWRAKDSRFKLVLTREEGQWRVDDFVVYPEAEPRSTGDRKVE